MGQADSHFAETRKAVPHDTCFSGASRSLFPEAYAQAGLADFPAESYIRPYAEQSVFAADLHNHNGIPFNLTPAPTRLPPEAFDRNIDVDSFVIVGPRLPLSHMGSVSVSLCCSFERISLLAF